MEIINDNTLCFKSDEKYFSIFCFPLFSKGNFIKSPLYSNGISDHNFQSCDGAKSPTTNRGPSVFPKYEPSISDHDLGIPSNLYME